MSEDARSAAAPAAAHSLAPAGRGPRSRGQPRRFHATASWTRPSPAQRGAARPRPCSVLPAAYRSPRRPPRAGRGTAGRRGAAGQGGAVWGRLVRVRGGGGGERPSRMPPPPSSSLRAWCSDTTKCTARVKDLQGPSAVGDRSSSGSVSRAGRGGAEGHGRAAGLLGRGHDATRGVSVPGRRSARRPRRCAPPDPTPSSRRPSASVTSAATAATAVVCLIWRWPDPVARRNHTTKNPVLCRGPDSRRGARKTRRGEDSHHSPRKNGDRGGSIARGSRRAERPATRG